MAAGSGVRLEGLDLDQSSRDAVNLAPDGLGEELRPSPDVKKRFHNKSFYQILIGLYKIKVLYIFINDVN